MTTENLNQDPTANPVIEGVVVGEKTSRIANFANKHPKISRALAITGAVGTTIAVACVAKTVNANRSHLNAAVDHGAEALHELGETVTPQSPDA